MADENITKAIQDAVLDADSLERFINGSDSETVLTRLSAEYPTLQKAIKQMFENGGLPATPFKTKALMEASDLSDGDYAMVTDDGASSGLYINSGGTWSLSKYNPTADAVGFATELFNSIYYNSSRNLFDVSSVTKGKAVDLRGNIITAPSFNLSDYILVKPDAEYTLSAKEGGKGVQDIAYFDSKKNFITRITLSYTGDPAPYTHKITTPSNATYVRFSISNTWLNNDIMINEGDYVGYAPYSKPVIKDVELSDNDIDIIAKKIAPNDFDAKHVLPRVNLINPDELTKGGYVDNAGEFITSATFMVTGFIKVEPNKEYSATQKISIYTGIQDINYYNSDKEFIRKVFISIKDTGQHIATIPDGIEYVRLNCRNSEPSELEIMFYKGSDKLDYTPYRHPTLTNIDIDYRTANNIKKKLGDTPAGTSRLGDDIVFTGDKHPAVLLDFPDSFTKDDDRNIYASNPLRYPEITAWWQGLVDEFPDYITKKKIGTDASRTYDVHSYTFSPKKVTPIGRVTESPSRTYARVLLVVQHVESLNQVYPFLAMREMCRKWQSDPVLAALRLECEFVVIPYHNPYGLQSGNSKLTSEGLNTNRDWPYMWTHSEDKMNGTTPFATQEARNVKAVMEEFRPHVCMDLHSHSHNSQTQGLWIDAEANPRYEASTRNAVLSLYPKIVSKWPDTPDIDKFFVVSRENAADQFPGYAYAMGATGGLMEFVKDYKGRPKADGLYNDALILSSSLLLNIIAQCIAEYRDFGRPFKGELYSGSGAYFPEDN